MEAWDRPTNNKQEAVKIKTIFFILNVLIAKRMVLIVEKNSFRGKVKVDRV